MNVNIEPDPVRKESGSWMLATNAYFHTGDRTVHTRFEWPTKECEGKEEANFLAKFFTVRYLIKIGALVN